MTRIELVRRLSGTSQRNLARIVGVHSSVISQIERQVRRPWASLRSKLAEALGCAEETLFGSDGWPLGVGNDFTWLDNQDGRNVRLERRSRNA